MRYPLATLLLLAVLGREAEAAVEAYRPAPSAVVLRLASSTAEQELMALREAVRAAPRDTKVALTYVDALIAAGARSGNERYYGYAEQVLLAAPGEDGALLLKQAQLLQHRHAFREAEAVLGALLERDPRAREPRLMRAQVRLHLREPQQALEDCTALALHVDLLTTSTCVAQARAWLGDVRRAYSLVTAALQVQQADAATRSWSAGVAGELAARLGDTHAAGRWYQEAFQLDPENHYARRVYVDALLEQGAAAQALQALGSGASLADRARRVLASGDAESADARRLQLAWQESAARGERAHLRDQARFELLLKGNAAAAHALAMANFREQREPEDALLLATTAAATNDRGAAAEVRWWCRRYRYDDMRLERVLGSLQ